MGKYIKTSITREIAVNSEVVEWNYWDNEHVRSIHEGYDDIHILLANSDTTMQLLKLKIPLLGFKINTLTFQHRPKKNIILVFTTLWGALQKTLITIVPVSKNKTKDSKDSGSEDSQSALEEDDDEESVENSSPEC